MSESTTPSQPLGVKYSPGPKANGTINETTEAHADRPSSILTRLKYSMALREPGTMSGECESPNNKIATNRAVQDSLTPVARRARNMIDTEIAGVVYLISDLEKKHEAERSSWMKERVEKDKAITILQEEVKEQKTRIKHLNWLGGAKSRRIAELKRDRKVDEEKVAEVVGEHCRKLKEELSSIGGRL